MKLFIPIKEKSERVPNKNFRLFGDVPLYKHCLYKFKNFEIFVDTDSKKIINEINNDKNCQHVTVYERSNELIGHDTSVNLLIYDCIRRMNLNPNDSLCQIHVTSPFLNPNTLIHAFNFLNFDMDVSVAGCNVYQSRFWKAKGTDEFEPVNHNVNELIKTQDLPKLYEDNSAFYIFTIQTFLKNINRLSSKPYFYEIKFPENIDIDTEDDWNYAILINKALTK